MIFEPSENGHIRTYKTDVFLALTCAVRALDSTIRDIDDLEKRKTRRKETASVRKAGTERRRGGGEIRSFEGEAKGVEIWGADFSGFRSSNQSQRIFGLVEQVVYSRRIPAVFSRLITVR